VSAFTSRFDRLPNLIGTRRRSRMFALSPLFEAAWIMSNVGVSEFSQQADRLLPERSGRAAAVGDDVGVTIGQNLRRAARNVGDRQTDRAGEVHRRERFGRQDVDERNPAPSQQSDELVPRDRRRRAAGRRG
jgi:hypothetical protein